MGSVRHWVEGRQGWRILPAIIAGILILGVAGTGEAALKKAKNPCAVNPCAANPCAGANPCNPCAGGGKAGGPSAKAVMILGKVDSTPSANVLRVRADGKRLDLEVGSMTLFREGPTIKSFKDLKPGDEVTVSALEKGGKFRALYVYKRMARAGGNPCNPCAANPCAAKNPCTIKNPCAGNPCSPKR